MLSVWVVLYARIYVRGFTLESFDIFIFAPLTSNATAIVFLFLMDPHIKSIKGVSLLHLVLLTSAPASSKRHTEWKDSDESKDVDHQSSFFFFS